MDINYSDDDLDIDEVLRQAENVKCINESSVKKIAAILKKKRKKNEQERIEHPNNPEKWVDSEVDLNEVLLSIKNLTVCTNLYKSLIEEAVFEDIIILTNHQNVDIIIEALEILKEITEPSNIYELDSEVREALIIYLNKHKFSYFIINIVEQVNEKECEEAYSCISIVLNILENIFELENNLQNDFLTNSKLIFFLLKRITVNVKYEDTNCLACSEILAILILRINQFAQHVYNDFHYTITIFNCLLKYISKYRKIEPENLNRKENLLNCFQALRYLLLIENNKQVFENTMGFELMLKALSERKFLAIPSLKVLTVLLHNKEICNKFVEMEGLKYLFCLFMLRDVKKNKVLDIFEFEENMITIISNLILHCSEIFLERVMNKFVEKKCEKIIRLLELRQKYNDIISDEKKKRSKKNVNENLEKMNIQLDEDAKGNLEYMELCDKGYLTYQLIDVILITLFFKNNKYICYNIFDHLYTRNINIQSIYENILDFLDNLDDQELKKKLNQMLIFFLTSSKESNLFI